MQADFLDAHGRHWDDAEMLFTSGRLANADHLYGIAAECGLKRLMLAFGMPFDASTTRPNNRQDHVHANAIWARFESYRCGHSQGTGYVLSATNPFGTWDISDRYAHQSNFDHARLARHKSGATDVCELIRKAQREGLLI